MHVSPTGGITVQPQGGPTPPRAGYRTDYKRDYKRVRRCTELKIWPCTPFITACLKFCQSHTVWRRARRAITSRPPTLHGLSTGHRPPLHCHASHTVSLTGAPQLRHRSLRRRTRRRRCSTPCRPQTQPSRLRATTAHTPQRARGSSATHTFEPYLGQIGVHLKTVELPRRAKALRKDAIHKFA